MSIDGSILLLFFPLSFLLIAMVFCASKNKASLFLKAAAVWSWIFIAFHYSWTISVLDDDYGAAGWYLGYYLFGIVNAVLLIGFAVASKMLTRL